ncbi:hypothetical protein ACLB2K_031519 [Fragaria x ananassa]
MSLFSPPSHFHLPNAVVSHHGSDLINLPLHSPQNPRPSFDPLRPLKLVASHHFPIHNRRGFRLTCLGSDSAFRIPPQNVDLTDGGAGGGRDGGDGDSSSGGDGGGGNEEDAEGEEFGPLLRFDEVLKETEACGVELPLDTLEAAKTTGLRKEFLLRYLALQGAAWPLGFLIKYCSMLRNRMLADPSFLFKVGTEIVIDSCCATFAEVQKRGNDFWNEFELYAADLLVGIVVDIALVGMLAPYARIGKPSISHGLFGQMQQACASLPSREASFGTNILLNVSKYESLCIVVSPIVFEAERPGCRFSLKQRVATFFYKGVLYGSVGFVCGIIGQGIANMIMNAKRSIKKLEEDVAVPPLVKSAALWGVFLAISSNTRYQIVNGLEGLVEASPLTKRVPPIAMAFTIGV